MCDQLVRMDDLDRRLVLLLQQDGRASFASLAEELGVSQTTVRGRCARLFGTGAMQVVALCDALLLGHVVVRIFIRVRAHSPRQVAAAITGLPLVNHVALVTGGYDLYLEATTRDAGQLLGLLDQIRTIRGVDSLETVFVTKLTKDYTWTASRAEDGPLRLGEQRGESR